MVSSLEMPVGVRHLSTCTIHTQHDNGLASPAPKRCHLTPWDICTLSVRYIQRELLFRKPSSSDSHLIVQRLKTSLSHTLAYFSPLAARFFFHSVTPTSSHIFIDCNDAGTEFIHAIADATSVADLLPSHHSSNTLLESFFPLTAGAVGIHGISKPLLAVQLTELNDGFFLACSFNHGVGDGSSFWHFFNAWAEMCRSNNISRPPILDRWFPSEIQPPILLPFSHPDEIVNRVSLPPLSVKFFHFSPESIAALKAMANAECGTESETNGNKISSFQVWVAHVWRCITRAKKMPACNTTSCVFSIDNRARLEPPLSPNYFGNCVQALKATATAGELASNGLGWAAMQVHKIVAEHGDSAARSAYVDMTSKPFVFGSSTLGKPDLIIASSPRFDVSGVDFGWGSAVAVRTGPDNSFEGKITAFPGKEGCGSLDLEVCLPPNVMRALEAGHQFAAFASPGRVSDPRFLGWRRMHGILYAWLLCHCCDWRGRELLDQFHEMPD